MMRSLATRLTIAALVLSVLVALPVSPDGSYFSAEAVAVSADQRAILIQRGSEISMTLSTGYTGDGSEFGWVIPVSSPPLIEDVFESEMFAENAFRELDQYSAPTLVAHRDRGCFPAGTVVHTAAGGRRIESLGVGSRVFSYDVAGDRWLLSRVEKHESLLWEGDMVSIRLGDATVEATGNHPVLVLEGSDLNSRPHPEDLIGQDQPDGSARWVEARALLPGDVLRTRIGETAIVREVLSEHLATEVFSLEVEEHQTYAIGSLGAVVHNKAQSESAGGGNSTPLVTVYGTATLQHYGVTVVGASDPDALLAWLAENDFAADSRARDVLSGYVRGGWAFVAVKLNPSERRQYENELLPPLTVRYEDDTLIFPLGISSISTIDDAKLTLFVLADTPMTSLTYPTTPLVCAPGVPSGTDPMEHVESFLQATVDYFGGRSLVLTFRDTLRGSEFRALYYGDMEEAFDALMRSPFPSVEHVFLTRFEGRMSPQAMNTDIVFVPEYTGEPFTVDLHRVNRGVTVEFDDVALFNAIRARDFVTVERLIRSTPNIDLASEPGVYALGAALSEGDIETARFLLDSGADVNAFHYHVSAVVAGDAERLRFLIAAGSDIDSHSDEQSPALIYAVGDDDEEIARLLLDAGADVDARNRDRETPLLIAATAGHTGIVRRLLDAGADVDKRNKWRWTALMNAARRGRLDTVRVLVEASANVNARSNGRNTPLTLAARHGDADVVRFLLDAGADPNHRNREGDSPISIAESLDHHEVIQALKDHGATQ